PPMGWYARQRLQPEEAVRGYTVWAAYASHLETEAGVIAPGRLADLTILDVDPFVAGTRDPARLLDGRVTATIVGGVVAYHDGAAVAAGRPQPRHPRPPARQPPRRRAPRPALAAS